MKSEGVIIIAGMSILIFCVWIASGKNPSPKLVTEEDYVTATACNRIKMANSTMEKFDENSIFDPFKCRPLADFINEAKRTQISHMRSYFESPETDSRADIEKN